MASPETLCGERCTLRALVLTDAPSLREQADDETVWRALFEGFPRPYTLADAQAWCGPERPAEVGHVWGIEVDGAVVGCAGVRPDAGWLRCNAEVGSVKEGELRRSAIKAGRVIDRVLYAVYRPT